MANIKTYHAKVDFFDFGDFLIFSDELSFSVSEGFSEGALKTLVLDRFKNSLPSHLDCYSFSVNLKETTEN